MLAYYNESDPFAAEWLRRLVAGGRLPAGDVDGRSIRRVRPEHVRPAAHALAGAGAGPHRLERRPGRSYSGLRPSDRRRGNVMVKQAILLLSFSAACSPLSGIEVRRGDSILGVLTEGIRLNPRS